VVGRFTVCVLEPVHCWVAALAIVIDVVPPAVAVVVNPVKKALALTFLFASHPTNDDAVGVVVTLVTAVPPWAIATVVPPQVPVVIDPTEVSEDVTTVEFREVPLRVPAGATTTAVD
jgi:hypothetical protein